MGYPVGFDSAPYCEEPVTTPDEVTVMNPVFVSLSLPDALVTVRFTVYVPAAV